MRAWLIAVRNALLGGVLAGCSGGKPDAVSVHGMVYYRGAPLTQGTIVFIPDTNRGQNGPLVSAEIQRDGSYTLHLADEKGEAKGVQPGWYRVTVVAVEGTRDEPGSAFVTHRNVVPTQYRDADLSGITCCVKPKQENVVNIHLD